jgi:hypothetical protein
MTVKFLNTAATYYTAADNDNLTFPNGNWTVGFSFVYDGSATNTAAEYFLSTGNYGAAGSLNLMLDGNSSHWLTGYVNGGGSNTLRSAVLTPGTAYQVIYQRSGTTVSIKVCPVLTTLPSTGAAVLAGTATVALSVAMNGPGLVIGTRVGGGTGQAIDHSAGRFFMLPSLLTDLEIAKLAYGIDITELGYTPSWYLRLNDNTDTVDRGALNVPFTRVGTLANGASMGYGYVPTTSAPSFVSAPAIIGTPQVGTAVTYTRGEFTGTPVADVTQQWYVAGVAVSGETGATYIPATADATKTLGVRQILTNNQGSASSDSAIKTVVAAVDGIAFTSPAVDRIYQRVSGFGSVRIAGTYTGAQPASVEYQLYAMDGTTVRQAWAAASASIIAGGTWSATLSIPQNAKKYKIAFRSKTSGAAVLATSVLSENFGVGDIVAFIGSSSASSWVGSISGNGFSPNTESTSLNSGNLWQPFGATGYAVEMAKYFANLWGVCVGIMSNGVPGTRLDVDWVNDSASSWLAFSTSLADSGNKLAGVFSSMGSNDLTGGYVVSRAQHAANLRAVIARTRAQCGQPNLKWLISGTNRRYNPTTTQANFDTQANWVRQGEEDVGADANVTHVQTLDFEVGSDGVHLVPAGFQGNCQRNMYVFGPFYTDSTKLQGPKIAGITYTGATIKAAITMRNGTDILPMTAIPGFTVTDSDVSGVPPTIVSAVRTSANLITIKCDRALTAPVVKYLSGALPSQTGVTDNSTLALPMTVETSLPATLVNSYATTVTFPVVDAAGQPVTGLVNLDYAFYDQPRISAGQAPVKYGTSFSVTNGTGSISIAGVTTLAPGGVGRIEFGDSALVKAAIGQATVS